MLTRPLMYLWLLILINFRLFFKMSSTLSMKTLSWWDFVDENFSVRICESCCVEDCLEALGTLCNLILKPQGFLSNKNFIPLKLCLLLSVEFFQPPILANLHWSFRLPYGTFPILLFVTSTMNSVAVTPYFDWLFLRAHLWVRDFPQTSAFVQILGPQPNFTTH